MRAIDFEVARQSALLDAGQRVVMETRYFDAARSCTVFMRSKESEIDYRYMPEPDLPPLRLAAALVQAARDALPELPDRMRYAHVTSRLTPASPNSNLCQGAVHSGVRAC